LRSARKFTLMNRANHAFRSAWLIADDLTGAVDAAVAFAGTPEAVIVELTRNASAPAPAPGALRVIDTETREAGPGTAAARVAEIAARIGPADRVFKKIDSLLRGPIAAELGALGGARAHRLIVLAPALPAEGRSTCGGRVVTATAAEPAHDGVVARAVAPLRAATIAVGPAGDLADTLRRLRRDGVAVAICDARSDADLGAVAAAGLALGDDGLVWCGSAGLARALARADPVQERVGRLSSPPGDARPLAIVGTHTAAGRRQAAALAAHVPEMSLSAAELLADDGKQRARLATELARRADAGALLVTLAGSVDHGRADAVASALALTCAPAVRAARTVVLSGGATAHAVLRAADVVALRVRGEFEPGVVVSIDPASGRHLVTKSGGFGDDQTLVRVLAALRGIESPSVEVCT
jgi:D-threonate/D-erythronate kinase